MRLARRPFSLRFKSRAIEQNYLLEVASGRLPVFIATASFDFALLLARVAFTAFQGSQEGSGLSILRIFVNGLASLVVLYSLIGLIYRRSQHSGLAASRSEILLASLISIVLCRLTSSNSSNSWIFVAFFLICTSTVLRLRWLVGAAALAAPVLLTIHQNLQATYLLPLESFTSGACLISDQGCIVTFMKSIQLSSNGHLPVHTVIHLIVAWAAGTLMGFLSDDSRRQSFASHRMALTAAATEVAEVRARVAAEKELASAQALAHAKSLLVDRERASNEAKSEFISMLCHEIRTPLNGCLASAEMLLQTDLDEDQKDLAHTVRVSGSILLSTVSNFLDFFKLEAGKSLDIVRTLLDVRMLVADVHRIIEAMVVGSGAVKLLTPDLDGTPQTALGDPARLCGILLNMYMNAAKFTKNGSIGLRVRVVSKDYRPSPPPMVVDVTCDSENSSRTLVGQQVENSADNRKNGSDSVDEDEDRNNRTGGREFNSSFGSGSSRSGSESTRSLSVASSLQHSGSSADSLSSVISSGVATSAPGPLQNKAEAEVSTSTSTPAAAAVAASITMSIQDEGDGWLSTASVPQLPNLNLSNNTPTSSSTEKNKKNTSSKQEDEEGSLQWVSFEVHDTGVGIAPKSLSALFHDYVQGDDDEMEKPRTRSGTGLGLAICGKQVAVLGGVIGALTKPGVGSVFWFKVPMLIPPPASSSEREGEEDEQELYNEDEEDSQEEFEYNTINTSTSSGEIVTSHSGGGGSRYGSFAAAAVNITGTNNDSTSNVTTTSTKRTSSGGIPRVGSDCFLDGRGLEHSWKSNNDGGGGGGASSITPGATPRPSLPSHHQGYPSNNNSSASRRQSYSQTPNSDTNNVIAATGGGSGRRLSVCRRTSSTFFTSNFSSLEGLRVLVVEDNMINRKVACRVLQSLGVESEVASNGQEAVDFIASMMAASGTAAGTPSSCTNSDSIDDNNNNGSSVPCCTKLDIVLMDMCMPVMNGVEATKAIRNLGCSVPIVAMTANAEEKDRDQCLAAGMNGFLSKPVLREQLAACILEAALPCTSENNNIGGGGD